MDGLPGVGVALAPEVTFGVAFGVALGLAVAFVLVFLEELLF